MKLIRASATRLSRIWCAVLGAVPATVSAKRRSIVRYRWPHSMRSTWGWRATISASPADIAGLKIGSEQRARAAALHPERRLEDFRPLAPCCGCWRTGAPAATRSISSAADDQRHPGAEDHPVDYPRPDERRLNGADALPPTISDTRAPK